TASYAASATLVNGDVDLIAPDIIRIKDLQLDWTVKLKFDIDLGLILPKLCLPQVCVKIPCVGRVCTPSICIPWPTIPVHVTLSDFVKADADFRLDITLTSGVWKVQAQIVGIPSLKWGPTTTGLLLAIG